LVFLNGTDGWIHPQFYRAHPDSYGICLSTENQVASRSLASKILSDSGGAMP
jgi:hypothetical protein